MRKIFGYAALLVCLFCAGCCDWLDVRPKSQVKEEDLFTSEAGFRDALTGIYALMGSVDTYGGNSTMGLLDIQNMKMISTHIKTLLLNPASSKQCNQIFQLLSIP